MVVAANLLIAFLALSTTARRVAVTSREETDMAKWTPFRQHEHYRKHHHKHNEKRYEGRDRH
jgi:hypothetical protein